jgi:hypothetical protein
MVGTAQERLSPTLRLYNVPDFAERLLEISIKLSHAAIRKRDQSTCQIGRSKNVMSGTIVRLLACFSCNRCDICDVV